MPDRLSGRSLRGWSEVYPTDSEVDAPTAIDLSGGITPVADADHIARYNAVPASNHLRDGWTSLNMSVGFTGAGFGSSSVLPFAVADTPVEVLASPARWAFWPVWASAGAVAATSLGHIGGCDIEFASGTALNASVAANQPCMMFVGRFGGALTAVNAAATQIATLGIQYVNLQRGYAPTPIFTGQSITLRQNNLASGGVVTTSASIVGKFLPRGVPYC